MDDAEIIALQVAEIELLEVTSLFEKGDSPGLISVPDFRLLILKLA